MLGVVGRRLRQSPITEAQKPAEPRWDWTLDLHSIITWSSPDSYALIGYRPDELVGRSVEMVMDAREFSRAQAIVNAAGVPESGVSNLIVSVIHRDGSAPWIEVSVRPIMDPAGALIGIRGSSRYIGPDTAQVLATQRVRKRIQHVIDSELLMTAFQPIVDVRNWTVVGVEGLTRFVEDPGVAPDLWFAEAAAVGLGTELELLALRTALTAAAQLPSQLYVSVNASPITCLEPALRTIIGASGIDPRRLIIEVTEHSQVPDYAPLTALLTELRAGGIRVAVDDAGAGFASGQHILKIKPDVIKLDRGIVTAIDTEPGQRALAAGLIAFARHIGAQVTAEGVESLEEAACVRDLGIGCVQGYFFGRPTVEPREWATWTSPIMPATRHPSTTGQPSVTIGRVPVDGGPSPTHWTAPNSSSPGAVDRYRQDQPGSHDDHPLYGEHHLSGDHLYGDHLYGDHLYGEHHLYGAFAVTVLDALPDPTAVLDGTGVIVAANRAWRLVTVDSGGQLDTTGVGSSYLEACTRAAAAGSPDALQALAALQAVLSGATPVSESEYWCDTPSGPRCYLSRTTAMGALGTGAVVSQLDITRRKRSEEELAQRSSHDPLTGLVNRLMFGERLEQALRRRPLHLHRSDTGVLSIDVDGVTLVNDSLGHAAGDALLTLAAHRLTEHARPSDTVARISGVQFAVCALDVTAQGLAAIADRMCDALSLPYRIQGIQVRVRVSVGRHLAKAGDDPRKVLQAADRNMHDVKSHAAQRNATFTA